MSGKGHDDRWPEVSGLGVTVSSTGTESHAAVGGAGCYLTVFEEESSFVVELPASGRLVIGRAPEVDIRVRAPAASRRHAELLIAGDDVRLMDLGSHNGTELNGARVASAHTLVSGDVIGISSAQLVFRRALAPAPRASVLDPDGLRGRAVQELSRAVTYGRRLALVSVAVPAHATALRPHLEAVAARTLRGIDVIGWSGDTELVVLMPELDADDASRAAARLLDALAPDVADVRAGVASCPDDGADFEALWSAARAARSDSRAGTVATTEDAPAIRDIGGQEIVVADPAMMRLHALIERLARSTLPVLVNGESGAGKEIVAAALHRLSPRADGPFVAINCAALPDALIESELFGHEKGAFSGADSARAGRLESADGGTVFLDEVAELSAAAQAKLLRVLEQKTIVRVGDVRERKVDIRLVAATHRDLAAAVHTGQFREDLFFRIGAARLALPPLRDRPRELPILARRLLDQACEALERGPMAIGPRAMLALRAHRWPGNVRELKNAMEFVAATVAESVLEPWHLPESIGGHETAPAPAVEAPHAPDPAFRPIDEEIRALERRRMVEALEAAGGVQTRAAELISMPLRTFVSKLKKYDLVPRRRTGK